MSASSSIFKQSIGRKLAVGATGLFLVLFLLEHLVGNLLLVIDAKSFEAYAHFMGTFYIIRILEVGLFLGFILHIYYALKVNAENDKARPVKYYAYQASANSSWFSRNMRTTGIILLLWLVLHLLSFWLGERFGADIDFTGTEAEILSRKVMLQFSLVWYVLVYIAAMIILGFHLNHGFQSAFQTLGWGHKKIMPAIKKTGTAVAILIPAAFAFIPIWFFVHHLIEGTFSWF